MSIRVFILAGALLFAGLFASGVQAATPDGRRPAEPGGRPTLRAPYDEPSGTNIIPTCGNGCAYHTDETYNSYYAVDFAKQGGGSFPVVAAAGGNVTTSLSSVFLAGRAAAGCPVDASPNAGLQGLSAIIDHGNGWSTLYLHMAEVTASGRVEAGTAIGTAGCTGANAIHLHFALRHSGWTYPVPDALTDPPVGSALDLALLIDTTGSMGDDIAAAKASSTSIIDSVKAAVPNSRIGVVDFRDFASRTGDSADYPYRDVVPFTFDGNAAKAGINSLTLGYGGDTPETRNCALMHIIEDDRCAGQGANSSLGGWRPIANKKIIYVTDAGALSPEPFTNFTNAQVGQAAIAGGVVVAGGAGDPLTYDLPPVGVGVYPIVIGTDPTALSDANALAAATGGQVFSAASASEVVPAILAAIQTILETPTADAGGPYSGEIGESLTFDASGSTDSDGDIEQYEWDWDNDGTFDDSSGSATLSHTYTSTYSGQVRLRVTDNDGLTAIALANVSIMEPPTPTDTATPTATATPRITPTVPSFRCADVTGDGRVNIIDVAFVAWHNFRPYKAKYDLNNDGRVTSIDVGIVIRQYGRRCTA